MLEVKDVTYSYTGSSMLEFFFDLDVGRGEIVAVSGRSGAGKSTLLNLIAGFLIPDQGKIIWQGQNLAGTPPANRPLSMIFQDDNLFDHLSCRLNVALGLRPSLSLSKDEWHAVDAAMDELSLTVADLRGVDLANAVALARDVANAATSAAERCAAVRAAGGASGKAADRAADEGITAENCLDGR